MATEQPRMHPSAPDLAVVIVNYNVRHFLSQALQAVAQAIEGLRAEVYVVDNNSVDGSQAMVRRDFPWVVLLANTENVGFARANNQAIRQTKARYVLLLNPDTVVQEDSFRRALAFMEAHPEAGGLGVPMYDGQGKFLPESKRSLPTPWVAFYKIFGLSRLFPASPRLGRYHLTYLSEHQTHAVEVLSGAFMWLRHSALHKVGLLDEDYFMYGEDVDLSYRLLQGGYQNYYFAETRIIHYKGESTRKGSLNYVRVFYTAMLIFARKHFARSWSERAFMVLIQSAIYLRAGLAIARRMVQLLALPLLEGGLFWLATLGIKQGWELLVKQNDRYYPALFDHLVAPVYAGLFVAFLALNGGYRKPYSLRGLFLATTVYGFLSIALLSYLVPSINFSRGIALLSALAALLLSLLTRSVENYLQTGSWALDRTPLRRTVLVGAEPELSRVLNLIQQELPLESHLVGVVQSTSEALPAEPLQGLPWLGAVHQLEELVHFYKIEEVIFCNQNLSAQSIIAHMRRLAPQGLQYKIVPPHADYLVGPNTILSAEALKLPNLHLPAFRLKKLLVERGLSLLLLLLFPLTFWAYHRPRRALEGLAAVLRGRRHLVSYHAAAGPEMPQLKQGLLHPGYLSPDYRRWPGAALAPEQSRRLDLHYARSYSPTMDVEILWRGWRQLGAWAPAET